MLVLLIAFTLSVISLQCAQASDYGIDSKSICCPQGESDGGNGPEKHSQPQPMSCIAGCFNLIQVQSFVDFASKTPLTYAPVYLWQPTGLTVAPDPFPPKLFRRL